MKAESKRIGLALSLNGRPVPLRAGMAGDATASSGGETDVFIDADHETIKTAVKNLVENAVNYSPMNTTVAVGIGHDGGKVTIRVVDQGIGIPAPSLDRIFERFYRVDPARSRETGGTGLGLAITKHCVQDCGGTITVWSREGEGSTFTITLPEAGDAPESRGNAETKTEEKHPNTTENTEENH